MEKENIYLFITLILLICSSFYLGINFQGFKEVRILEELKYNDSNCSDFNLFDTAECLNQQLREFFYYNLSNTGKNLSLIEFKTDGGVCSHASKYYKDSAEELGFYGTTCIMNVYEDLNDVLHRHEIAIISNKEGYVVLDQWNKVGEGHFNINSSEVKNEE